MRNKLSYLKEKSASKKGRDQEDVARKHINSGAVYFDKGDLDFKDLNIDVKNTDKKQYIFKIKDIKKHYLDSIPKTPVFLVYIGDYVLKTYVQRRP